MPGDIGNDLLSFGGGKVRTLAFGSNIGVANTGSKSNNKPIYEGPNQNSSKAPSLGIITPAGNIDLVGNTGTQPPVPPVPPVPPIPPVPPKPKDPDPVLPEDKTNVPSNAFSNVPSTVAVIAPQQFFFPGFGPIGSGGRADTKERTKFFNEQAAATSRLFKLDSPNNCAWLSPKAP